MLTISSVLIPSRESEVWLWEEGRKEETRMYMCPGHARLVLDSIAGTQCFPEDRRQACVTQVENNKNAIMLC